MAMTLETERKYFEANLAGFMKFHENEYALVHERAIVGFFPSEEDAVRAGRKALGSTEPFLVALVTDYPTSIQVSTFILGQIH